MTKKDILSAIMGLVVGDALGVPVEFKNRTLLKNDPVVDMRSYGTHNQPAGTWSDDSSMALATLDWYIEADLDNPNYDKLMQRFFRWYKLGEYTPHGKMFDIGMATTQALTNFDLGMESTVCGGIRERDNGNGSLMRILPSSLLEYNHFGSQSEIYVKKIFDLSALTHGHIRSKLGCLIYSYIVISILNNKESDIQVIIREGIAQAQTIISNLDIQISSDEMHKYDRVWNCDELITLDEDNIRSSGYVVDTLEAAIWCFANTRNYKDCVLRAVNLGEDTDTIGAVAGGLAGLYYGIDSIPTEWMGIIARRDWIEGLVEQLNL